VGDGAFDPLPDMADMGNTVDTDDAVFDRPFDGELAEPEVPFRYSTPRAWCRQRCSRRGRREARIHLTEVPVREYAAAPADVVIDRRESGVIPGADSDDLVPRKKIGNGAIYDGLRDHEF